MTARLCADADIRAVFAARRVAHGTAVVVHGRRRADDQEGRAAVVAGRKVGGAVARNRAKRRLRAALQSIDVPPGADVVLVARPAAGKEPFEALREQLARQVTQATSTTERR